MTNAYRRPLLLAGIVMVLLSAEGYLLFELGRYQAGYSVLDRQREIEAYEAAAAADAETIEELKRRLAILETSSDIDRETYTQLKTSLTQLEAQRQTQEEELAFYRGIISPPDGVAGLRIQSLEVAPAHAEQRYVVHLVLMQAIVHNGNVSGVVRLRLAGIRDGVAQSFDLEQLADDGGIGELDYGFRYFQGLEQSITLPDGFEPATVEIEIWPTEPRGDPVTQSFSWAEVGGEGSRE